MLDRRGAAMRAAGRERAVFTRAESRDTCIRSDQQHIGRTRGEQTHRHHAGDLVELAFERDRVVIVRPCTSRM